MAGKTGRFAIIEQLLADGNHCPFWLPRWWSLSPQAFEQLHRAIAAAATAHSSCYAVDLLGIDNIVATIDAMTPQPDDRFKL